MLSADDNLPGFAPEEILTGEPTRSARLKWVVVADESASGGTLMNAVACVAASTGAAVGGLIGPGGPDAAGQHHPGLPWAGCSVLAAAPAALAEVRARAAASPGVLVVDMPRSAQATRVYDEYLAGLSGTKPADLADIAVSIVGPRSRVARLVKGLSLLA